MNLTQEQQNIINEIKKPDVDFLSISAIAGSGKTATLIEISNALKPTLGLYIAYNKAIATEAKKKFGKNIDCMTTHSLAYQNTVKDFNLEIGVFNYRSIKKNIPFEKKILIIENVRKYCLSKHISFNDYCLENEIDYLVKAECIYYLGKMRDGSIQCTHEFYLKFYHIMLASKAILHPLFDLIMLDEAGDLNPVTLEIFKLLPASKKIMVGDPQQNIYSFNETINGFEVMKNFGKQMTLSKSFRVSKEIANKIKNFSNIFLDKNMKFDGVKYTNSELLNIKNIAYISRTNSSLIDKMIQLNKSNTSYKLTRTVDSIFALPLALIRLSSKGVCSEPQFKYLEEDYNDFINDKDFSLLGSFYTYLLDKYSDEPNIKTAIRLIMSNGPKKIINTFEQAKSHQYGNSNLILMTAHSSKGLEADEVIISDDLNSVMENILDSSRIKKHGIKAMTVEEREEFRLGYVAASRARKRLKNAKFLNLLQGDNF